MNETENHRKFNAAKDLLIDEIARSFMLERTVGERCAEKQVHPAKAAEGKRKRRPGWPFIYCRLVDAMRAAESISSNIGNP